MIHYFTDPTVRDSTCEALGTLMKLVGEKAIGPFVIELEKDNLKMAKIKECCEKAVIIVKIPGAKKERPTTAPVKSVPTPTETPSAPTAPARTKRPVTGILNCNIYFRNIPKTSPLYIRK